jgi:formylglycine-generating enzyme required for sulfatase activity
MTRQPIKTTIIASVVFALASAAMLFTPVVRADEDSSAPRDETGKNAATETGDGYDKLHGLRIRYFEQAIAIKESVVDEASAEEAARKWRELLPLEVEMTKLEKKLGSPSPERQAELNREYVAKLEKLAVRHARLTVTLASKPYYEKLRIAQRQNAADRGDDEWWPQENPLRVELQNLGNTRTEPAMDKPQAEAARRLEAQDPFAGKKAGQELSDNELKMKLCWCPPGKFKMGGVGRYEDEVPVDVTLSRGFWMGKHEVTQAQFQSVMGKNPSDFKGGSLPVDNVNWNDATAFCKKLTKMERAAGRLPQGWEYRLPTEAQWEYACRAGTNTAFHFGDSLSSSQANFNGNHPAGSAAKGEYLRKTTKVGSYSPNAWGLCDMHGNVAEWCRDRYREKYPGGADPEVTIGGAWRVYRGGSWAVPAEYCLSQYRMVCEPERRYRTLGFRVAAIPI